MKPTLQLLTTLALFAAMLHCSSADPIVACGASQFVAHDQSLCLFYQCANGKAYEFACSKGTRVPSYYLAGNVNPCTIKVKTSTVCARCNVSDDRIPEANATNQCARFHPCATRPGCTCVDQVAGYYCSCPIILPSKPLPTPESKPVSACDVNVCKNGGQCYQLYKNKFCNCPPPYTGPLCEANACDSLVCENGVCDYDSKGVFCKCEPCFSGSCCEIIRSDLSTCSNCSKCYGGANCQVLRDHLCDCNPCQNRTDSCTNGVFGKKTRSCIVPPTTASHTFTLMFGDNDADPPEVLEVYASAALDDDIVRNVVVDAPLGTPECSYSEAADIPPGVVHKFNVNICLKHRTTSKKTFGIRVREINRRLVNVYCISRAKYSADGWLALPDTVAGMLFTAVSYSPIVTNSLVSFVATEDNTIVHVYLSSPSDLINGSDKNGHLLVNLNAYETYQVQAGFPFDLTGSVVQSNKPIHVYSGEARGWVGPSPSNPDYLSTLAPAYPKSRDVLIFECPSVREWGSTFAIVPLPRQMIGYNYSEEVVRVVGTKPTRCDLYTTLLPNGTVQQATVTFGAYPYWAQFYVVAENNYFLACDNPVQIVEITESSLLKYRIPKNDGSADPYWYYDDPSFIFVPSVASYSNFFRFVPPVFSVTNGPYLFTYIRLIARESDYQGILLNDQPLYPTPPAANEVVKPWSRIYVPNGPQAEYPRLFGAIFRLSSNESSFISHPTKIVRFMAVVEGFDDRESYGFPLGADMFELRFDPDASLSAVVAAPHPSPLITVD